MKTVPQLVLTVVVSGLTAVGAASLFAPTGAHASTAEGAATAATVAGLETSLAAVEAGQRELRASLDNLALRLAAGAPRENAQPLEDLEGAVTRVLEQREAAARSGAALAAAAATSADQLDLDDTIAALLDPTLDSGAREALWQKVREAGLLDEVLAVYEARAKANPNDPTAQVELGEAYLQKIFEVGSGPMAGVWANKADGAFDAALALDDHNWDARFTKAVSLSFWPPIFGKQPDAIEHFQTLLSQQAGQPKNAQYAQTYLMLGNLYAQQGKSADAEAMWKQGLQQYPDNAALKEKFGAP